MQEQRRNTSAALAGTELMQRNPVHSSETSQLPSSFTDLEANDRKNGNEKDDGEIFLEKLTASVTTNMLGTPLSGFRLFFYTLDPFKPEQFVRAPKMFDDINIVFTIIYFAGLILFIVYAFLGFYSQTVLQTTSMVSATALPPITVNITGVCSAAYQCGTWSTNLDPISYVTVTETWTDVPSFSPCFGKSGATTSLSPSEYYQFSFNVTVCYSASATDGIVISMPFNSSYPTMNILIDGMEEVYHDSLLEQLIINTQQWKTVFFSQTLTTSIAGEKNSAPSIADLFYNGHAPLSSANIYKSTLTLRVQQFGYTVVESYGQTFGLVMASIGGFSSVFLVFCAMIRGTIVMSYKSCFVLKGSAGRMGLCTNALQLGMNAIARLFGLGEMASSGR
jgi:hypothetical protein